MLTEEQLREYAARGYVVLPALLSSEEVADFRERARTDLRKEAESDTVMRKGDSAGKVTLLKMWYTAGDDFYGRIARDERLVTIAREVIGRDTYLYSHKMTMKEPRVGGAWEWHQDYGYWYQNKCLAPDMLSIWIALDASTRENGCLQVLSRSHRLGRLDHVRVEGQTVVDAEYLAAAQERFDHSYVEMEAGDALVFDCNLLHRSDANTSDGPRWGYIASYNAVDNEPFRRVRDYGHYQELVPVPAGAFRSAGVPQT
jgi:ectoine hydroxylase-related dioxygenase (phytanoyl-CoA dioxygenase family)